MHARGGVLPNAVPTGRTFADMVLTSAQMSHQNVWVMPPLA